jgi:hypothetical protein
MLQLAEIRILAQEYPDSAQVELDTFLAETDTAGLSANLEKLWEHPLRGRYFMQALHDSLQVPLREDPAGSSRVRAEDDEDGS